jgi:hypothetical protein
MGSGRRLQDPDATQSSDDEVDDDDDLGFSMAPRQQTGTARRDDRRPSTNIHAGFTVDYPS